MDARERARNSVFYTSGAQILEGEPCFKEIEISDPGGGLEQIGSSLKLFLKIEIFLSDTVATSFSHCNQRL